MVTKTKIFTSILGAAVLVALLFVLIGYAFEPLDPFRRADAKVQCSNSSQSVVFYQRKTGWLAIQTELSVELIDASGQVVHSKNLGTLSHWNDVEMKARSYPQRFCEQTTWDQ